VGERHVTGWRQERCVTVRRQGDGRLVGKAVVVAATPLARVRGLLGRRALAPGEGLLLTPCNAVHSLGMAFAIDAVYLDGDGRVVRVLAPLRPWRLGPMVRGARAVLELRAGSVGDLALAVGDRLVLEAPPPPARAGRGRRYEGKTGVARARASDQR
jgi:uncharacterized membrane protein (UPF0127 family)